MLQTIKKSPCWAGNLKRILTVTGWMANLARAPVHGLSFRQRRTSRAPSRGAPRRQQVKK
eukprot:5961978-Pyramimonas_sp.AAC.1